ncbi:MAG: flavin reductase family protein [Coprococcus sp.]|nr:flavin reductase family protein [Coprococcus sp.]
MKKINLPQASKLTSPNPVTLVCTQRPDGGTNLATVSWWTYLSFNPSMIAYAMAKTSYSGEMVRSNGKVILTIPGTKIAEAVMGCGSATGRNTDKASQLGIELMELEGSTIKIPTHSRVAIQCSLKEYHEVGDHYLYICDVEKVYGNESEEALFAWNGYAKVAPARQGE